VSLSFALDEMSTLKRTILFGTVSGLMWAIVPLTLSELWSSVGQTVSVFIAGAFTGISVSLVLSQPVCRIDRKLVVVLGFMSLPLGAFLFGVIVSFTHLGARLLTGASYRFVEYGFDPFRAGAEYAVFSVLSVFGFVLVPLAVATTYLLRNIVCRNRPTSGSSQ
jgi:hypothetical protein